MKIVYLNPKSTFPFLSSDSIFGAIISAVSELFPEDLDGFLDDFKDKNNVPFLISSAFPFVKLGSEYLRFYPKPLTKFQPEDIVLFKKFKKIKFLDEEIFLDLISGNISNKDLFDSYVNKEYILNKYDKSFLIKSDKENILNDNFYVNEIQPHNMIDRINENSINIFYSENYRFKENSGLFFLVDFIDGSYENKFFAALKFLEDRGFGKDISTGSGHFDFIIEEFDVLDKINNSEKGQYFVSLSRFIPDELDLENINKFVHEDDIKMLYEISDKRSRDSFGLRKKIRFFKESSVFPFYSKFCGSLVETSNHSIEYGYSFNIRYAQEDL